MKHIILGASGTIGHQLFADLTNVESDVVGTYCQHKTSSLKHFDMLSDDILRSFPELAEGDCVYLLASHINPNWIYQNSQEAYRLNVEATKQTAQKIASRYAKVVFVSTELVFDGTKGGYREDDPPNPLTKYGQFKQDIEEFLKLNVSDYLIIRTGANVSWRAKDNCPVAKTYQTLLGPGAKMAVDNIISLTDVRDLSCAVIELVKNDKKGIYHAAATPAVSRTELAECVIRYSQNSKAMAYEQTDFSQINYPEARPRQSWLDNTKICDELNIRFTFPEETIRKKVSILDDTFIPVNNS